MAGVNMRYAIIENNKVINVVVANEYFVGGIQSDTANIGDNYINGEFIKHGHQPKINLEISLSGGDGRNDPIGMYNDGINAISVNATLKMPDNSILPVTKEYRIILRLSDGTKYEMIGVNMINGICSFDYTSTGKTGEVTIEAEDMTETFNIGDIIYGLDVVGDCCFKVYRKIV